MVVKVREDVNLLFRPTCQHTSFTRQGGHPIQLLAVELSGLILLSVIHSRKF